MKNVLWAGLAASVISAVLGRHIAGEMPATAG
jgi:hypothetical protein